MPSVTRANQTGLVPCITNHNWAANLSCWTFVSQTVDTQRHFPGPAFAHSGQYDSPGDGLPGTNARNRPRVVSNVSGVLAHRDKAWAKLWHARTYVRIVLSCGIC